MNQKYIEVAQCKLAYYEYNPDADKTVFFIHGNSLSSRIWQKQLESPLLKQYRLVAIDLPAHGNSGASENAEQDYCLPGLGKMMAAAVTELIGDKPFVIAGLSLGTNILAEMLAHIILPSGIILAGPSMAGPSYPITVIVKEGADTTAIFTDEVSEKQVKKYAYQTSLSRDTQDISVFLEAHAAVKFPFRSVLFNSIMTGNFSDQVLIMQKLKIPVLVVFGEEERIIHTDYLDNAQIKTWRNKIFKIPDAGHLVNVDQPQAFNELVAHFLEEIFK